MALSKREKTIGLVAGAAIGILGLNYYVLEPYVQARENVANELKAAKKAEDDAQLTIRRQVKAKKAWKIMTTSGLMTERSAAEQQMASRMEQWARQCGVESQSQKLDPVTRNDQVQVVKLRWTGTGSMANASKLMWRIETADIPLKIDEVSLAARKEGTDDLTINLTISTIWQAPDHGGAAGGAAGRGGPAAGTGGAGGGNGGGGGGGGAAPAGGAGAT